MYATKFSNGNWLVGWNCCWPCCAPQSTYDNRFIIIKCICDMITAYRNGIDLQTCRQRMESRHDVLSIELCVGNCNIWNLLSTRGGWDVQAIQKKRQKDKKKKRPLAHNIIIYINLWQLCCAQINKCNIRRTGAYKTYFSLFFALAVVRLLAYTQPLSIYLCWATK